MASAVSASGFGLSDDSQEQLVAEGGNDLDRSGTGMGQQVGQLISFIAMQ